MRYETIDKITVMTGLLQRPNGVTIRELCDHLECSERGVHRLREKFEETLNIDVVRELDVHGRTNSVRWKLPSETWRSPIPVKLESTSWLMLQLILGRTHFFESPKTKRMIQDLKSKIESSFIRDKKRQLKTTYLKFTGGKDYSDMDAVLSVIGDCLRNNRAASVTYRAAFKTDEKTYDIEPYTLVDHGGSLYLLCAVPKHERKIIALALERIISMKQNINTFKIPDDYSPENYLNSSFGIVVEEPFMVKVHLYAEPAYYALDRIWGNDQSIEEQADGSIILSFTSSGRFEIMRWILSCGKNAKVLEPSFLVAMVAEEIAGISKMYPVP